MVNLDLLTEQEKEYYSKQQDSYLKTYPYLKEPAMRNMLDELIFMEIRMARLNKTIMDPNSEVATASRLEGQLNNLRRTYAVFLTRMGISYIARQRRQEPVKKQSPLEKVAGEK
jgi:hypothetical protein